MKRFTYIILLFIAFLVSCDSKSEGEKESIEEKRQAANTLFSQAAKASNERDNWKALSLWERTEQAYFEANDKRDYQYLFLVYKQKANVLNRLKLYRKSVVATETSMEYLADAPEFIDRIDPNKSELSARRYLGTYIRDSKEYLKSNEVLLPLISYPEKTKGLNAQVQNLIGLNFYDLQNFEQAHKYFDLALKREDIEAKMKAHYLINRGKAQYKLGNKMEAFNDINQALGINQGLGRDMYTFLNYMELGELNMLETNFNKADQNFNSALSVFNTIDTQPDHFKIYNLKYTSASVLGTEDATQYKIRFDSLTERHEALSTNYTLAEEEAMYAAGIGKWEYENLHPTDYRETVHLVLIAFISVLVLIAGLTTKQLGSILKKRRVESDNNWNL